MAETSFKYNYEEREKVVKLTNGTQSVSGFARAAFIEKLNRMEKRDERARRENLKRDAEAMIPVIIEAFRIAGPQIMEGLK